MPTAAYPARKRARMESRDAQLQALGHRNYSAYLSSPAWQAVKARYRASDLPQDCGLCEQDDGLDMHHMTYERVGQEELTDLVPLCRGCHRMIHVLEERGEIGLDFDGLVNFQRAARYAREDQAHTDRMTELPEAQEEVSRRRRLEELSARRQKLLSTLSRKAAKGLDSPGVTHVLAEVEAEMASLSN